MRHSSAVARASRSRGSVTFTPKESAGKLVVPIKVDVSQLGGTTAVVFEKVSQNGKDIAKHENPGDKDQIVHVVHIGTVATDAADGDKYLEEKDGTVTVNDEVSYSGLVPGEEYTMTGTLHRIANDGTDGGAIDGATGTVTFTPDATAGKVIVPIRLDVSQLGGTTVVAFERVSQNGKDVAKHENPNDKDQIVHVVRIGTTATDANDGDHDVEDASKKVVIHDDVKYDGLVPGTTYTMTGTLHLVGEDGSDAGVLKDASGKDVTVSSEFIPQASSGSVTIEFKFNLKDAKQYDGRKVVAFEECSESGRHVAAHADVHDENQIVTLHVPAPIMQTGDSMTAVGVATIGVAVIAGIAITIRRRMTK